MKIFLDTANPLDIAKWSSTGVVDGVTTNPTLLAKEQNHPKETIKEICQIMSGKDVSVEITQTDPEAAYTQAQEIAKLANNIVVKIPCHVQYYHIIERLINDGIKINGTLVFTLTQGLFMCKLGVSYISPFIGRWDDINIDGISFLCELRAMMDNYKFETKLLAASLRHTQHIQKAILAGADIATIPPAIMDKITQHPMTTSGMNKFNTDWKRLGLKRFP